MAKKAKGLYAKIQHVPVFHKTNIGRNPSKAKMNKSRRRSFKKYRGQGKYGLTLFSGILYYPYERKNNNN